MPDAPADAGFWGGRRTFVTGATGIVGSWLVRALLDAGAEVIALVQDADPRSEFYRSETYRRVAIVNGQLEDYSTLERAINGFETSTVIHLGAQTQVGTARRSPLQTFEANIRGTYNLLEACRVHANIVESVVVASSDKAYGDHQGVPYDESAALAADHPYDVSKSCADLLAHTYAHTYGLPVTIARCGNIYGGGDLNWSRIVPGTIAALHAGQPPAIRSDGTYVRDYLYVRDAAGAYMLLAERGIETQIRGEAFNFSGGQMLTVLEMVRHISQLMETTLQPVILNTAKNEIPQQILSTRKAQAWLGWSPSFGLDQALQETIDWYRALFCDHPATAAYAH